MNNPFKQLFCKHVWRKNGFSYIKCKLCERVKTDHKLNAKLRNEFVNSMIDRGVWESEDVPLKHHLCQ